MAPNHPWDGVGWGLGGDALVGVNLGPHNFRKMGDPLGPTITSGPQGIGVRSPPTHHSPPAFHLLFENAKYRVELLVECTLTKLHMTEHFNDVDAMYRKSKKEGQSLFQSSSGKGMDSGWWFRPLAGPFAAHHARGTTEKHGRKEHNFCIIAAGESVEFEAGDETIPYGDHC